MVKFTRNKIDIYFWLISAALLVLVIIYVFLSINFISRAVVDAVGLGLPKDGGPVKFNLDKVDELRK